MLRLTEVKLPIDHPEGAIQAAILKRLGIPAPANAELFAAVKCLENGYLPR